MSTESRSVVVRLSMDTAQAIRDSKQFGDEFERAMTRADQSSRRVDQSLDKVGSTAGRAAAGAATALGLMGKAAIDWESQFAGVEKTVDGTAQQMAALEDELRELARTMPATHQEIAATAEAAGQLGVAREDVADFTETMIQLGETTNLTADEAATSIAQMANVLGTSQADIDNVGAALVALGNDGASTEAQILGMAQRIAGAGAQIGLAESDILAIANAAASMGVEVEAGGSSISRVFTEMAKATAQGGDNLAAFAKVAGVSSQEFVRAFQDDPAQAFAAFTQGLDRINKSGGDVFTTLDELQLSDVRVSQALLGMAASGDLLTDSLALGAEAFGENTALAEEYAKRADTTAAEVQVAWNNIKDAGIEAGAALLPIVSDLADGVSTLAQTFGSLPDPVQSSLTKLLAITAIVGGAAWFGTKTIGAVVSTRDALADLADISPRTADGLNRVTRAGAGIAAVAGAVTLLGNAIAEASGAKLDTSDLARDLEAVVNGSSTELITRVVDDLKVTTSASNKAADYLYEGVTLFGVLGDTGLDTAQDNLKAIDQELAGLVESGNADRARAFFEGVVAEMNGLAVGSSVSQAAIDALLPSFSSYETALGNVAASGSDVGAASDEAADGIGEIGGAAGGAAVQVEDLMDALDGLLSPRLNLAEATDQWRDGLRNFADSLDENSRSLVGNTDAASTNRAAVRDRVRDLLDMTKAQADAGAGTDELTDTMRRGRQAILDAGQAAGVSSDDMKDYLEVLGLTPKQIRTTVQALTREANANLDETRGKVDDLDRSTAKPKVTAEVAGAQAAIQSVWDRLTLLDGKTATTWVTTRTVNVGGPGPQMPDSAFGNIFHFANGDVRDAHQPELYRGGTTRVWGEPETGGEAYIPLRNDARRPRARAIATETVRLLGGTATFADGGINKRYSLEERGEILELRRSIRDLTRSLNEKGKGALGGLDRKIALNDLAQTRRELRSALRPPSLTGREVREAIDLEAGMSRDDIREEYADFKRVLREAGIELPKNFDKLREKSLATAERFEQVTKQIEETETALDEWRETAANIASTVGAMFNNDAFGLDGGGLANAMLQLEADRNDTAERNRLLQSVTGLVETLGLDKSSEAYQAIAIGADMQTLRDLDTAAEVQAFFELFNSRLQEQTAAGEFAANAVTGAQIASLEATQTQLQGAIETLTTQMERQEQRLEGAAVRGTREGSRAGVRQAWSDQERVKAAKARTR